MGGGPRVDDDVDVDDGGMTAARPGMTGGAAAVPALVAADAGIRLVIDGLFGIDGFAPGGIE